MTFFFSRMAPPGAATRHHPVACWLRDAKTGKLVQHWIAPTSLQPAAETMDISHRARPALSAEHRPG